MVYNNYKPTEHKFFNFWLILYIFSNEDQNILANSYKQDEIQQCIKYLNSIHIECDSIFFLEEFFETLIELSALVITLLSTTQQKQLFKVFLLQY